MSDDAASGRLEELEATIDGLTAELLDLQVRVSELEDELADERTGTEASTTEKSAFVRAEPEDLENGDNGDYETIGEDIIIG
ncbi:MAG: DUF7518 family protein [Halodesulfurarchaeum sp.]